MKRFILLITLVGSLTQELLGRNTEQSFVQAVLRQANRGCPMKSSVIKVSPLVFATLVAACGGAKFLGGHKGKSGTSQPPKQEVCQDQSTKIGAYVAVVIDNSGSNSEHDCPNAVAAPGPVTSVPAYRCEETNRERAVLRSLKALSTPAVTPGPGQGSNAQAQSFVGVVEFPTKEDPYEGHKIWGQGWQPVDQSQGTMQDSLAFTRTPYGQTPYGSGLSGAKTLMAAAPKDRPRAIIFLTDGEPTDRQPSQTLHIAEQLKADGIEILTVFVNTQQDREKGRQEHRTLLKGFQDTLQQYNRTNWWIGNEFPSFESYLDTLLGGNGKPSLLDRITSPSRKYEVSNSQQLETTLNSIVKTISLKSCIR